LDFITTLSHDIRTPLTLIKGYARGLESGEVTDNVMKQKFKSGIVQSVDDIENLVYNVLDFAYEVNFDYSYQIQKHDVNYVVEEIIFEINQLYSDYDKKINFKIDDFSNVDKHVNIDLMNIKRVIINLLNNSFKYTEMSDLIEMRIVNRNGLYFEIYDEGLGIRDENLLRIYELFYRTEDSKDKKGYGLGLYICNQILKNHGIELLCDSVYGEYTQMKFIIPFEEK
jgi:K+-sensing histidine kinase KdpD